MSDLIDRQVAIDALATWDWQELYLPIHFKQLLEELPSAEPERKWIPCSEKLPEDGVEVWVAINGFDVIQCEDGETLEQALERVGKIRWVTRGYWCEEEHGWNNPYFGSPLVVQPIAWMPIDAPDPYTESGE